MRISHIKLINRMEITNKGEINLLFKPFQFMVTVFDLQSTLL